MLDDVDRCYRAVQARDVRFDGLFFTAVTSTGIYCRPSCPATTPKQSNVRFFRTAAAAQRGGFRACKRCRPDVTPGSPEWDVRADVVGRAMRLIEDGVVERDGVPGLAARLGYSERHLNRTLVAELGAGPLALARARRAQAARALIETTDLSFADVAFASGFSSVRQFNDTVREVFALTPSQLRSRLQTRPAPGRLTVRLAVRRPFDAGALLDFLGRRAVRGVEEVVDGSYRRSLRLPYGPGVVTLTPDADGVSAELRLHDVRDVMTAVARCRRALDLDADPVAVADVLGADPLLGPLVAAAPGLRVPGTVDPAEIAVRAVLGQQVSVAAARTTAGKLVEAYGEKLAEPLGGVTHVFPAPDVLAAVDPAALPMPASRGRAVVAILEAVASGAVVL
ncbi:bifunctional transcriptional activator/DNA repair enzyme AdaA, partial [Motilibacter deserti]|nr:DNA-3-methyladenine glycosylase 2 family protein [Motilibacter deserti]